MKLIILGTILIATLLNASIDVKQNMKALYRDVELTTVQEDYILDNQDNLKSISQSIARKEAKHLKNGDYINEKSVVEFMLNTDGSIGKIKYLSRSNERSIDKLTKTVVNKAYKRFPRPEEVTPIRLIFIYQMGKKYVPSSYSGNSQKITSKSSYSQYQNIPRGTTRFEYSSKEYVREFETSKDGFINMSYDPTLCVRRISILTMKNQKIRLGYSPTLHVNVGIPKGKYKLLVQTNKTCNISLQYP